MDEILIVNGSYQIPLIREVPADYMSRMDLNRKYDPIYYLHDFWNDVSDPDINAKPFMSGGPLPWLGVLALIVLWIRVIGPNSMKNSPAYDMKPALLIINGLTFGGYITGLLTGLWYSNWGMDSFSCDSCDLNDRSIDMYIRKSTGYVFFISKIWDFLRPIFSVYRKRDHEITNMYLLHCYCCVLFVFMGLKLHPGGVFTFLPYVDGLYQIFAYCYLIMACANEQMKPSHSFRVFLYRFKVTSGFLMLAHGLYFLNQPNCGPIFLKLFQIAYATIGLVVASSEWDKMENARKQTARMKQMAMKLE